MIHTPSHATHIRDDRGFTIVEVIIALLVLSIVLGAAMSAVAGSEHVSTTITKRVVATNLAEKAFERAKGDLAFQKTCNDTKWRQEARSGAPLSTCTLPAPYLLRDGDGRPYQATVTVRPKSTTPKAAGEFTSRDAYDAVVSLAPVAQPGQPTPPPTDAANYQLSGSLGWNLGDDENVVVTACQHYRMDRSVDVADCDTANPPVPGVAITLTPINKSNGENDDAVAATTVSGSSGVAPTTGLRPGDYRVSASATGGLDFYRASPEFLHVDGGVKKRVSVLMVPRPSITRVCYQLVNTADDKGWGFYADATNFDFQEHRSPVYRFGWMTGIDGTLQCQASALPDPLGYAKTLFQTGHSVEAEELGPGTVPLHPADWALKVKQVAVDCSASSDGTVIASRSTGDPKRFDKSWQSLYTQKAGAHTLCFSFESLPIGDIDCGGPAPGCINKPVCVPAVPPFGLKLPPGWDPCAPAWWPPPPVPVGGPFNPCPGGSPGPWGGPASPAGTYAAAGGSFVTGVVASGTATYYGPGYYCRFTASGDVFDPHLLTASHLTQNYGRTGGGWSACALVTWNGKEIITKVNDSGGNPAAVMDMSEGTMMSISGRLATINGIQIRIVQTGVPNGKGCGSDTPPPTNPPCAQTLGAERDSCDIAYPPKIENHWVKAEAKPGSANPSRRTDDNAGAARRTL